MHGRRRRRRRSITENPFIRKGTISNRDVISLNQSKTLPNRKKEKTSESPRIGQQKIELDGNEKMIENTMMRIIVTSWSNRSIKVPLMVAPDSIYSDLINISGLAARDGSPSHCLDESGRIIDGRKVREDQNVFIGVTPALDSVWIEKTVQKGRVGVGILGDGTTAFIPGVFEGDFVWVYRIREWARDGEKRCNATRVRVKNDQPFEKGDLIYLKPRYGEKTHPIYNSASGLINYSLRVVIPKDTKRSDYEGIDWVVEITSTNPIRGMLRTDLTYRPKNQKFLAEMAKKKAKC